MLGIQAAGRARGVGRFTRQFARHLLERPGDDDFLLYFHDGLPGGDEPWPSGPAVRRLGGAKAGGGLPWSVQRLARRNPDQLDVLLLSCALENFQGYLPPDPPLGGPRMAAVVHDLIPSHFPDHYLRHPAIAKAYHRALASLRQYDLLLVISEAVRSDCARILGIPDQRVVNISAGSDPLAFFPDRNGPAPAAGVARLRALGVSSPFLFALTALDERKNLPGLLAAYRLLPARLRQTHALVLTCAAGDAGDHARLRDVIRRSGVAERVVLTSAVDDESLRALYQRCSVFVFPSRCEGFGLPLLEAMQCGAAVVAGGNSSQVEVVGDAGLLADADDPADLARQLTRVLDEPALAEELRRRAVRQARMFDWATTARVGHAALARLASGPPATHWVRRLAARGRLAVTDRIHPWGGHRPPTQLVEHNRN
ncbi:MAG TPA: glycosyltransferase family 1 protein [Pirellulales bacterium]|nr:glycosyltransferase family 1 protein [Pirellulales bacterium]